jgi:hypothetical protein
VIPAVPAPQAKPAPAARARGRRAAAAAKPVAVLPAVVPAAVEAVLDACPGLRGGAAVRLNGVAKALRDAGLLSQSGRTTALFKRLASHFELLPDQRGMMLFVGDCLMGAVVTPHPDDYRVVYASTVCDLLAPVFVDWSLRAPTVQAGAIRLDSEGISDLDTLEAALGAARRDWAMTVVEGLASRLIGRTVSFTPLRTLRGHRLGRFVTGFDPGSEEHLGELILSPGGRLGYLKILRLPPEEVRKAAFLESLAALDWDLVKVQESMGLDRGGLRRDWWAARYRADRHRAAHPGGRHRAGEILASDQR